MFHSLKHVKFYRANAVLLLLLAFSLLLSGCQASGKTETDADAAGQEKLSSAADTEEIFSPAVRVPVADGSKTLGNTEITIDISHTDEGYLMAAYHGNTAQDLERADHRTGSCGLSLLYQPKRDVYRHAALLRRGHVSYRYL